MMDVLTPYKMPKGGDVEVDVTAQARDTIGRAIQQFESRPGGIEAGDSTSIEAVESAATKLLMAGRYSEVQALEAETHGTSTHLNEMSSWSFFNEGTQLALQAGMTERERADRLYAKAFEKYRAANKLSPEQPAVFNNWGLALVLKLKLSRAQPLIKCTTRLIRNIELHSESSLT